jgi:DNA-binding NarL/FixJ family response regulator
MIEIFIVDDHFSVIDGIKSMVENEKDLKVVGDAGDAKTALREIDKLKPDIVIMDIGLPNVSGTTLTEELVKKYKVKVIAFTGFDDIKYVQKMLLAGAAGYVLKSSERHELIDAIKNVNKGKNYLCNNLTSFIVKDYKGRLKKEKKEFNILTVSERKVLQILAEGKTRHEAADYLGVDVSTISSHRRNILEKLGLKNSAELIKYGLAQR